MLICGLYLPWPGLNTGMSLFMYVLCITDPLIRIINVWLKLTAFDMVI